MTADGDNIKYNKYSPEIKEEKIKKLISKVRILHKIDNMNFDYYYKINTSHHYLSDADIIKTVDEFNTDYTNNKIISAYRDYYSVVDKTTNIYGEKSQGSKYYEGFISDYAKRLSSIVMDRTDEYIYNLVGEHHKEFKHQEIKPVLEHLRNATKKSFSFKVITNKIIGEDALVFSRYFEYKTTKTSTGYEFVFENQDDYNSAKDITSYRYDFKDSKLFKWVF
jgi:hypothetical protein